MDEGSPPAARHPASRPAPQPATRRLFIALWPPPVAQRRLRAWLTGFAWPRHAAAVDAARLHLTLHFLGNVAEGRLDALRAALHIAASGVEPFELCFDRVKRWPHGLVVLGLSRVPLALEALHAHLAGALRSLDLPVEARAFRPHLTLARKAAGAAAPNEPPDIRWPVADYSLVQSENGYRSLQDYPFTPP